MDGIQWVFLDIGSTLVDESLAVRRRAERTVAGSGVSFEAFYDRMTELCRTDPRGYQLAAAEFNLPTVPWDSRDERPHPEAADCLRRLRERYRIGVVANQVPGCEARLEAWGLLPYIDLVVASAEEGVAKPDPRIFEIALRRAGCEPREAVMVGDRIDNDVRPARALGMGTLWLRQGLGSLAEPQTDDERPDRTVYSLDELADLLTCDTSKGNERRPL